MERWRKIYGFKGAYEISDYGRLRNKRTGVMRKTFVLNGRHKAVTLVENGIQTTFVMHRLVAEYFVDNPNDYRYVIFKDGNYENLHYTNLEWVERNVNSFESKSKRVLQLDDQNNVVNVFDSAKQAAKECFCNYQSIYRACRSGKKSIGYYWKYEENEDRL